MPLITPQNAREMAARAHAVRYAKPETPLVQTIADAYADKALTRTRAQLDMVADQITAELEKPKLDSRRLRDLTDAQTRLAEQERILAGRPLPGSRRPAAERSAGPVAEVVGAPRPAAKPQVEPVKPLPATPACGLDTPTGGVPAANVISTTTQSAQSVESK